MAQALRVVVIVASAHSKAVALAAPKTSLTPCILDDDHAQLDLLSAVMENMGYQSITTSDPEEALGLVRSGRCRLVLADVNMPGMNGYEFLDRVLRSDPGIHVIVMTGEYTLESALDAIRRGAADFLPKPIDRTRLKRALDEVATIYDQRKRVRTLEEQLLKDLEFHGIVGKSPAMLEVFDFSRKVAKHYTNVLLVGSTGTGKELVARAIHNISPLSQQKLAICNCSAMVDTLLESQLFGHMRGSFTGATDTTPGLFEYANNGTVFLDEIGETSLRMQAKLLRVIQNREIQRVGSQEVRQVNVRLIAATNRDLRVEVLAGKFREDLFYRLNVIPIVVPPLRERPEDVPLLVQHFTELFSRRINKAIQSVPSETMSAMVQYDWPGNVRELQNVIERAVILSSGGVLRVSSTDLKSGAHTPGKSSESSGVPPKRKRSDAPPPGREQVLEALKAAGGRVGGADGAAARLRMKRTTLIAHLNRLGIHPRMTVS